MFTVEFVIEKALAAHFINHLYVSKHKYNVKRMKKSHVRALSVE